MATAIEIIRRSEISWVIIPDGVAANETQEAWWRGTRIGDLITFKSTNGAVEFKDINYQYISYTDEVTPANDMASFASGYECYNYLKEQGFFEVGSGSGSVATTFKSLTDTFSSFLGRGLQVLRVNEAMTAIESFVLNAASKLSELTDGPGAYSNGKYLKSTSDGWVWSDGFNVNQNNIGLKKSLGYFGNEPSTIDAVTKLNAVTTVISEIQTPVIVFISSLPVVDGDTGVSKLFSWLFLPGKGTYGIGGTAVTASMLFQLPVLNLTPEDIENDPNAVIINIDPVVDGDYITKANESFWDFSDSDYENGTKSYYFSYTFEGDLYYALFVGEPGTYGDGGDSLFTEDDFVDTTNSGVQPEIPEGIEMWVEGEYSENQSVYKIINSQLYLFRSTADGNTTEPFLNSQKEAWSVSPYGGTFVGEWSAGAYTAGNIVSRNGFAYSCLTNNSTDPELLLPPNWVKLGAYQGVFNSSLVYNNGDVVIDGSNAAFLSNYNNNEYLLNNGIVSKWDVVNGQPNVIVCWGDSFTAGTGSTGLGNFVSQLYLASGINTVNKGVPGETSTQIRTRFEASPELWDKPTIIWAGYNNNSDPTTVKADIAAMVSKLNHGRYLILGIVMSTTDGGTYIPPLNADLEALYPGKFLNVQDYIVETYNISIPQDVTDHANGDTPWSKRSDWLHFNNDGYYQTAKLVLSKINVLLGEEYTYSKNLNADGIRVTGNTIATQKTVGGEILYRDDIDRFVLQGKNRITGATIPVSVGFETNSDVFLVENGGTLNAGNIGAFTSGNISFLGKYDSTGRIVTMPKVPTNYYYAANADGTPRQSLTYDSGSVVVVNYLGNIEVGFPFQTDGSSAIGTYGQARHYLFSLDGETAGLQVRDLSTEKDFWVTVRKLFLGSSTDDGTGAKFQVTGRASVSQAPINPTEVVRLEDLSDYALDSDVVHKSGPEVITGVKDFPNSITIPDGLASNNPASIGQLNTTNATVAALASRSLVVTGVTAMQTSASLNSAHPSAGVPTYVAYPDTSGSPMIYQKVTTTQWIGYAGVLV